MRCLRSLMLWKNCFRKKRYNDIYQESVVEPVFMCILTCYPVIDALGPSSVKQLL